MAQAGTQISGRYTIKMLVGHGGMGTVYCARDERLGRDVALKILREDYAADAEARARFLREGQIAAQIVHPNVVRTYDAGDDPNGPFLVQEYLKGQTLDQILPLPLERAVKVIQDVARALEAIHKHGYVHCDVKPHNILLRDDGTAVLLDFGIARAAGMDATTLIATPHYLAPERAQGASPTVASDLYALGIVFFHLLTGSPPFDGPNVHTIIEQHIKTPLPPSGIPDPLAPIADQIIAHLTAKRPEDRYVSAAAVQEDLKKLQVAPLQGQPTIALAPDRVQPIHTATPSAQPPIPPSSRGLATLPNISLAAWSSASRQYRRWIAVALFILLLGILGYGMVRARRTTNPVSAQPPEIPPPAMQTTIATIETVPPPIPTAETIALPAPPPEPTTIPNQTAADTEDNTPPSDGQVTKPGKGHGKDKDKGKGKDKPKD